MPSTLSISFNAGLKEKIDPKVAPFGVLKLGKNLRHREAGGLGMRYGYAPAGNGTLSGTMVAFDLHEFQGRLLALGSDQLEGYPHDLLEFVNLPNQKWRSAQGSGNKYPVSPFTNAREVAGVPQVQSGVQRADAVSGGGYTLLLYQSATNNHTYATIVDSRANQTVHFEDLTNGAGFASVITAACAAFAGGKFFVQAAKSDNSLVICSFQVGVSSAFTAFATVDAANAAAISAHDLVPVARASTALLCSAFDRGSSTNLSVKVWQSNGSQLGSTISVAGTNTVGIELDADQTDNTILLATVETAITGVLRTFNFAGTVLAGPTTVSANATRFSVARKNSGVGSDTAILLFKTGSDAIIDTCAVDTHAGLTTLQTLFNVLPSTRVFNFQTAQFSIAFGGMLGTTSAGLINALFAVGAGTVHAATRDYLEASDINARPLPTLTYDATTGTLTWLSIHSQPGTTGATAFPAVTLIDYRSTARMQAVNYGGLRYFTGAAPWIYDGRAATEAGFFEPPVIVSVAKDNAGGFMTPSAKYTYVAHWEVTYADGSFIESAPSLPFNVTMGASDTETTVVVAGPHSLRIALGGSAIGSSVTLVLSRTQWSPTTVDPTSGILGSQFSIFRRSQEVDVTADVTLYGQNVSVVDGTSDDNLATRGAIYTQADRGELSGPVEHDAPESCSYITASESAIFTGGLVRPFEVQSSLVAFLGQPFAWSFFSNFYGLVSEPVRGVYSLHGTRLAFTQDDIYALQPGSPDDEGKGSLGLPVRLSAPSGLKDWRSLVEEPGGLWCQLDDDKLFRLPLGPYGVQAPTWDGADVQRTLAAFPTITAAARHKGDNVVLFAACNAGLTDARIIVRDLLLESWLLDTPPLQASKGIEALTVFGRQAAYISGGIVYVQTIGSFVDGTSTFIALEALTQPIYPFKLGGYGLIQDALLTLEWRGDCVLNFSVSYDDGLTFTPLQSFTLAGLTFGQTVQKRWALPQIVTSSVVFDITVTSNGAPSEGVIFNGLDLLMEPESGLRELNPGDSA